jgi:hypothetical protein
VRIAIHHFPMTHAVGAGFFWHSAEPAIAVYVGWIEFQFHHILASLLAAWAHAVRQMWMSGLRLLSASSAQVDYRGLHPQRGGGVHARARLHAPAASQQFFWPASRRSAQLFAQKKGQ